MIRFAARTGSRGSRFVVGPLVGLLCACGAAGAASRPGPPISLALKSADGRVFGLEDLRGQPLLIFVFATYDDASQLALTPLEHVLHAHASGSGLHALGIAAQPDPERLLPLYREALGVSFALAYDPENLVVSGKSALGALETVPTFFLLDAEGRLIARHTGAMTEAELERFLEAIAR